MLFTGTLLSLSALIAIIIKVDLPHLPTSGIVIIFLRFIGKLKAHIPQLYLRLSQKRLETANEESAATPP